MAAAKTLEGDIATIARINIGTARIGMISFRMQKISFWWVILEKTSSTKNNDAQWMELCLSLEKYI